MSYSEIKFEGKYKEFHTKIKQDSKSIGKIAKFDSCGDKVGQIDCQAEIKNALSDNISYIENYCNSIYQKETYVLNKTKICKGVLFDQLSLLKDKIELYNQTRSKYKHIINIYNSYSNNENGE